MPLNLIVGRANTGKSGAAYSVIRKALKDGLAPVLVVPSVPDVDRARQEFSKESSLGLSVLTFDGFVETLWAESGDGRHIVAPATKSLLLMRSLRSAGVPTGYRGLASLMVETLGEQVGLLWREVRLTQRTDPMASTLVRFAEAMGERGLVTHAEAARVLSESHELCEGPIVVHRFDDFSPAQIHLLKELSRTADVAVTLTWEAGFAPTSALDRLVADLEVDHVISTDEAPYNTASELVELADGLFGTPSQMNPSEAVVLGVAEGEEAHSALIVEAVQGALDRGVAPSRIAVTARALERHHRSLRRVFSDAGIAADFDVNLRLGETAFGAAVIEVLRACVQNDMDALMAVARTPYSGLTADRARELEARIRSAGATSQMARVLFDSRTLDEVRRAVAGLRNGSGRWWQLAEALGGLYGAAWRNEGAAEEGHAALDAKAHRAVVSAIEAAQEVGEGVEVTDVLAVLEEQTVHPGGIGRDCVQVLPVTRLRGMRFDVVAVAGLNAGEFPATPNESGLPGSRVHDVVCAFGGTGIEANGPDFEELLFYETISRATQQVVLVGKNADDEGQAAQLSPLWEMVADRYAPDREKLGDILNLRNRELVESPRLDARGRERWHALARAGETGEVRVAAASRRMSGRPGALADSSGLAPTVFSASQIESYLSCPYRWFYNNAIGASDLEQEFGAADEGSLAHLFLKSAYDSLLAEGHKRVTPSTLPEALRVLDTAAAEHEATGLSGLAERVGTRLARQWAERVLRQDAEDDSGYVPWALEWSFGYDGDAVDLGGFGLRGTVDRIDADGHGHVTVTDYKRTAKSGLNGFALLDKRAVQVLLYMEAVARVTGLEPVAGMYRGLKESKVTGVLTVGSEAASLLTNRNAKVTDEQLAELRAGAVELAAQAVAGMRAGHIDPEPFDDKACTFCGARSMCGEAR